MNKTSKIELLLHLAEISEDIHNITATTSLIAKGINKSQQSASRNLIALEKKGLIARKHVSNRAIITITDKGVLELKGIYLILKKMFGDSKKMEGTVFSGLGEGKYYMSLDGYVRQFVSKFGFKPYSGTLNLRVKSGDTVRFTSTLKEIHVEGFKAESRTFGGLICYHASISNNHGEGKKSVKIIGAIVIPERTHYDNSILELIAPINLRKRLSIKDGDKVMLQNLEA